MTKTAASVDLNTIVSLCKRRGFIFQSSEIYGGLASTWDYGPLGTELKRNIKEAWWQTMVYGRDDVVGLDAAILMHPDVWRASGHVESFADPLVECNNCKHRFRLDQLSYAGGEVTYDISDAGASREAAHQGEHIIVEGISITAPDSSMVLSRAILDEAFDPVPPNQLSRVPQNMRVLETGMRLSPGLRQYLVGFKISSQSDRPFGTDGRVQLSFRNSAGLMEPVAFRVNPGSGQVTQTQPSSICPNCEAMASLTEPRMFNLMFSTQMGPVEDAASVAYLRPETAQGIFVNFSNVLTATRRKLPFGIAQIGKAFRNEITTGNFIFRTREFEIMEIEFFVRPGEDEEWHRRWIEESMEWYTALGISEDRLRLRAHGPDELAHYSTATSDIEYLYPWGWGEISGIANRTDFDLKAHSESTGEQLTYFDDEANQHITPYVIEPTFGVDRAVMTFLVDSYTEEEAPTAGGKTERRVVLKLHPALAPVKVAVLPLSRNERLVPLAREVYDTVRRSGIRGLVQYDDAQSIGRRYRRQDEIGTPLCVTVDFDSLDDSAVTIRERDSMAQVRVPIAELAGELKSRLDA